MFSSYEMLKSQIDYQMEDVRKTMKQCKSKRKKNKEKCRNKMKAYCLLDWQTILCSKCQKRFA